VDDNWTNLLALKNIFSKLNYPGFSLQLLEASTGRQAIQEFCRRNKAKAEDNLRMVIMD
jgi:CheY-like chemotaxis protein